MALLALLLVQEHGEAAGHAAGAPTSPFDVNFGLFVWTWIVFLVLLWLLSKFAWPSIVRATEEREQAIQRQLADAERLQAEARAALDEQRKLLAEARAVAQSMIAEAKAAADRERAVALEKVKQEQEEMLERARKEIVAERERAIADLRREAVDLSLAAAAKLVGERLDSETDRKIVTAYLATLEAGR